jgi:hypothetical protein
LALWVVGCSLSQECPVLWISELHLHVGKAHMVSSEMNLEWKGQTGRCLGWGTVSLGGYELASSCLPWHGLKSQISCNSVIRGTKGTCYRLPLAPFRSVRAVYDCNICKRRTYAYMICAASQWLPKGVMLIPSSKGCMFK